MKLAVIPARGGSKRIPRKNVKDFCGEPMIAYAIKAAKQSGLFEHIVVSTDDEEIAKIANDYGAKTPFMRPLELADDFTPTVPVVTHAINACETLGWSFDHVCCIYPCVPLIKVEDLLGAYRELIENQVSYCFPVTKFPSTIQRALKKSSDGMMEPMYPEFAQKRTQDLEPAYYDAGQFYWGKTEAWNSNLHVHSWAKGYEIPNSQVVDIDTEEDWSKAEFLFLALKNRD